MNINDNLINQVIANGDLNKLLRNVKFAVRDPNMENNDREFDKLVIDSRCIFDGHNNLTLLGFINGILSETTNKVLVELIDEETNRHSGYEIRNKF